MTTPHQSADNAFGTSTDMLNILGMGAFRLGGGDGGDGVQFGQKVTDQLVRSMIHGAAPAIIHNILDIPHFFHQLGEFLKTLPLEALQMMQEFIPGAVLDDFQTVAGAVDKIIGALSQDLRVTLQALMKLFAIDQLKQAFTTFRDSLRNIDWTDPGSVRGAFGTLRQFVSDLGAWAMQVVVNFSELDAPEQFSDLLGQLLAPLELPMLRDTLMVFHNTWHAIDWTRPASATQEAWQAVVLLVRGIIAWAKAVLLNFLGVDYPGFFALDTFRGIWSTFQGAWSALDWSHPVAAFQDALRAILALVTGTWHWVMGLLITLFGLDLTQFFSEIPQALRIDQLRSVLSTFRTAWQAIDWSLPTLVPSFQAARRALGSAVFGVWGWVMDVADDLFGVNLRVFGQAFHVAELRSVWDSFTTEWDAVVWVPPHFRDAIVAVAHLVRGVWRWAIDIFLDLFGIDLKKIGAGFEPDVIQGVWSTFTAAWSVIHWTLPEAIPDLRAGIQAVKGLVHGTVSWAIDVFTNFTDIGVRHAFAAFALPFLRDVISTFQTAWGSINWLTLGAFRRALSAVISFVGGVRDWVIIVVKNFVDVDLSGLRDALGFATLRAAFGAYFTAVAGLSWATPLVSLVSFIGDTFTLFRAIGSWILLLLHNLLGMDTTTVHGMFSSVSSFIDGIIRYCFGDAAVTAWHHALDFLSQVANSTPWAAAIAIYGQIKSMLDTLHLPHIGHLPEVFDGVKDFATDLYDTGVDLYQLLHQGLIDAIGTALGHLGGGWVAADITTFLENTPYQNIKAILAGGINLGQDIQDHIDSVMHALGFSGPGFSLASLRSALGAIPGGNIAAALGRANMQADLQALGTLLFGSNTVGSFVKNTVIQSFLTGGTHLQSDLTAFVNGVFGTTTLSGITSALGGAHLKADVQAFATKVFGSATVGTQILNTAIQSALVGGTHLAADMQAMATKIFGTTTLASLVPPLGGAHIAADLAAFATNILGSATSSGSVQSVRIPSLPNTWAGTIHGSRLTGAATIATSLLTGFISSSNVTNVLGGAHLGQDLQNMAYGLRSSLAYSGALVQDVIPTLTSSWAGAIHGGRITGANSIATSLLTGAIDASTIVGAINGAFVTIGGSTLTDITSLVNTIKSFINTHIVNPVNDVLAQLRINVGVGTWPSDFPTL